ncbi:hypothetical protein [Janthinobacterium sp. MDB2-8]|uniref:hypothetical protein n=1 Tax=Janthinobacterium sp. MDB2-8 TaxID=1259338 RepID=UPI003F2867C8
MSSTRLNFLINEFPEEVDAISRLGDIVCDSESSEAGVREVTSQRMYDLVRPSSLRVLVRMMARAAELGVVEKSVRVESIAKGGIGDFASVSDIPPVIYDSRLGYEVEVSLEQIRLIYKVNTFPCTK